MSSLYDANAIKQQNEALQSNEHKTPNSTEGKEHNLPFTGVAGGPVRFWEAEPPDKVRFNPDTVRPKSLNPLPEIPPPPSECRDSVRGLKCLQRHALMFKRIRPRSTGVDDEDRGKPAGSKVLVCEVLVLALRSRELRGGEESGSGSGSESTLWRTPGSVCARSINTLREEREPCEQPGSSPNDWKLF